MKTAFERLLRQHILEKATLYLVIGIIVSISHDFHSYPVVVSFGHILVASSFLILISMTLNSNITRHIDIPRRVSESLDIFSGAVFVITFAAEIVIFIINEINHYHDSKILSDSLFNHLFFTFLIVVLLWLLTLSMPLLFRAFKRNSSIRDRTPSILFITSVLIFIVNALFNKFPIQNVLIILLPMVLLVMFFLKREPVSKIKNLTYFSHLFLVLTLVSILSGILALFSKAVPSSWFWIGSAVSFFASSVFILLLNKWRRKLFFISQRYLTPVKSFIAFIFSKIVKIYKFVLNTFFVVLQYCCSIFRTAKRMFIIVFTFVRQFAQRIYVRIRFKK